MRMRRISNRTVFGQSEHTMFRGKKPHRPKCAECGKVGHDASKCWIKHPELKPKEAENASRVGKAPFSMMAIATLDSETLALKLASQPSAHWYLDSGASDHFSPFQLLYDDDYEALERFIPVQTAEGVTHATAIGTIKVSAHVDDGDNLLALETYCTSQG